MILVNFKVLLGVLRSFLSGSIVYIEINSPILPDVGAQSNLLVFWINVSINIATPHSDKARDTLYTKIVKSLLIISKVPSKRRPFSFIATSIYLNNTTVQEV